MYLFGEYEVLSTINRLDDNGEPVGGEAIIQKVRHKDYGDIKALRILKTSINSEDDEAFLKFKQECKLLLRIGNGNHPNIIKIHRPRFYKEPGQNEGKAYVEMDFVDGKDILRHLREDEQNLVPIVEVIDLAVQISDALAFCHVGVYLDIMTKEEENGLKSGAGKDELIKKYRVVHNDIHSNNIMRCNKDGHYVLLDFGLAFEGNEIVRGAQMKGVMEFMAPEKLKAFQEGRRLEKEELTPQLDIYSFGVVLYEYLTGQLPNKKSLDKEAVGLAIFNSRKHFFEKKYPGKEYTKDYPDWLVDVILKCIQVDPANRFKDGEELHDCIVDHLKETKEEGTVIAPNNDKENEKGNNKKWLFIIAFILLICGLSAYFGFFRKGDSETTPIPKFEIAVKSDNPNLGTATGGCKVDSLVIVTIKAVAKEGCQFVKWNDGNTDSIRTVVADHDQEFIAFFEPNSYPTTKFKITVESSAPPRGTVTEGGIFDSLTIITIKAMPKEGYVFTSWNDGNKKNPRTIKVTANQRFVATFKEKPSVPTSPTPEPSDIKVDWNGVATYTGPGLGNQPNGLGGKLVFYKDYQLDLKHIDGKKLDIKAGEVIESTKFKDGKLIIGVGSLHRKDGTTHLIM